MFSKNENIFAEYKKLKPRTEQKPLTEAVLTEDKTPVIAEMKVLLATAYTLAVKSQNYHWNVTGPNFVEYHNFLGEYYNFLNENIDIIAEQIRTMDARSPGSLAEFLESSRVNEETGTPNALQMLGNLAEDNQTLADVVLEVIPIAEANSVTGLVNYLEDFVDKLYKQNWFLKSIQGTSLQESVELEEGAVASARVRKEIAKSGGKNIKQDKKSISFEMDGKKHTVALYKNFVADKDYMELQDKLNEAGYMDPPTTKAEVDAKNVTDEPEGDSRDVQKLTYEEALSELKIKKLDKDTISMLKSLDPDEARMIIQGLPTSLRRKAMKELGLKEKVDGRTKGYKETVSRLMAKKEQVKEETDEEKPEKEEVPESQQKSFTVNLQNLNGPNTKKVMDILLNHEVQDNIVYTGDTDKGLTFKVKDEDGIRGLGLQLKKFKIDVAMQEAVVKEEEETTATCGCGPDCSHCGGKHSSSEIGKKCDCCGNKIEAVKKEEKSNEEALEERRAFIFAAAKAKANGEKKFIFNGKEFKVKLKNGPTVEADVKDEEEDLEVVKEKKYKK